MAAAAPLALGAGLLGGVFSALGAGQSAKAQEQMYNYQAGLAAQNATIEKQNAQYALMTGEQQAAQSGMRSRFQAGQIKTAEAASGFNVNTGSNAQVQAGQKLIAGTEQTAIRSTAAKQAYDYDIGGFQSTEQAAAYTASAANVAAAAPLNIGASILGSGSSVASKWAGFNQSGALPSVGGLGF